VRRGVTPSDERTVKERCLSKGVEVSDLAALKDFFRFQVSVMRGRIEEKSTDESLNSVRSCKRNKRFLSSNQV